jgi:GntR family transcriptional repressor for pyruvate dehydrogenase complex
MTADIFDRVEHGRTADEVVHQIEKLILESVLRVGERLPGERELARQLDVSRPILREALKELEHRGLIVARAGGGTYVADIVGGVLSPPLFELISRHRSAARDYLEYRREVEGLTAAMAARRARDADRAMLSSIIERMRAAHERVDFDEEAQLDVELHNAIGECAHNIVLLHTLRACYRLLADGVFYNRTLIYGLPGAREKLLAQHARIAEAVIAGDEDGARIRAGEHIDYITAVVDEAERTGDWARVADLRLRRRLDVQGKTEAETAQ